MNELNHQYEVDDHYHERIAANLCVGGNLCSGFYDDNDIYRTCNLGGGANSRPYSCVMNWDRIDISASTVMCPGCRTDMTTHLNNHH